MNCRDTCLNRDFALHCSHTSEETQWRLRHISQELTWTTNTGTLVKTAQQRLYFIRTLQRANLSQQLLLSF